MEFVSTRDPRQRIGFSAALSRGLAAGGGLYVPLEWPAAAMQSVQAGEPLAQLAAKFIAPFAAGDPLALELPAITAEAFNFPAPLVPLERDSLSVL